LGDYPQQERAGSTCCLRLKNLQPSLPPPPLRMKLGFHFRQLSALWLLLHSTPLLAALQSLVRHARRLAHCVCAWALDFFLFLERKRVLSCSHAKSWVLSAGSWTIYAFYLFAFNSLCSQSVQYLGTFVHVSSVP
jgi:hypothetical protein